MQMGLLYRSHLSFQAPVCLSQERFWLEKKTQGGAVEQYKPLTPPPPPWKKITCVK